MLKWLKNMRGTTGENWRKAQHPVGELEYLWSSFHALDSLKPDVADRIMNFIVLGGDDSVLKEISSMPAASGALGLRSRSDSGREVTERDLFFSSTTISEPELHWRLGLVLHAASLTGRRVDIAPGLLVGADFLDSYIWEATQCNGYSYPRRPKTPKLSAPEFERMLELNGNPASKLVRAALFIDPSTHGWLSHSGSLFTSIKGFHDALVRHLNEVRACLAHADHRAKTHAIGVLQGALFSPKHVPDTAVKLAVDSSKVVREAAQAWIDRDPKSVVPQLQQVVEAGSPEERLHAVRLFARIGGEGAQAVLQERLPAEKSKKVAELIESILRPPSEADLAAETSSTELPALPSLPDVMADQALDASILEELHTIIEKTNVTWASLWERQKSQSWAPKKPPHIQPASAKEWFALLQNLDSNSRIQHAVPHSGMGGRELLEEFAAHPKLRLVHVLRWCTIMQGGSFHHMPSGHLGLVSACLTARILKHGPIDYRELAEVCHRLGFDSDWIGQGWLQADPYFKNMFNAEPPEFVWSYFAERLTMLEEALGWKHASNPSTQPDYWAATRRSNAWRALAGFPTPPPSFLDRMWETALSAGKTERPLVQEALLRAPNRDARIIAALSSGLQDQRTAAAEWLGRIKAEVAIPALRTAVAREKHDVPKAAMIGALERLGVSPDEFLDRKGLQAEAVKLLGKGIPAALQWFPFAQLPVVHWADNGEVVAPEILKGWLAQSCKLKQPEPGALLRRYAQSFRPEDRAALGEYVLDAWMAEDVMPITRQEAEKSAMNLAQTFHQSAIQYPQYYSAYQGKSLEQIYASLLPNQLEAPRGSATDSKGILALAAACAGTSAAEPVARYLKKWYGTRVHQAKALLQMLAWVDHPNATQTLLAIGTRFRTKSLQEEATKLAREIAERKGWSLAELADRTIPTAGLDEQGLLELDYGARQFQARLDADLNLTLADPDGKTIKSLPEPRKDDHEELAAAAKKQLATSRKELKQVLEQQRMNLYEAMCVERAWDYEDWEPYLNRHPVVRHYCQRIVWMAKRGEETVWFRPLADGTLSDVEDNALTLQPDHRISIGHHTTTSLENAKAWIQHFDDYEVTPLFEQFGRSTPESTSDGNERRELKDFEGWLVETFKLRTRATKLGYTRGATGDGGWFNDYVKRFTTTGIRAVVEFTGNSLPEENRTAAMLKLSFHREDSSPDHSYGSVGLRLSEVPTVLLAECWNDFRQMAAEGPGYDADWAKKSQS
ncbi:DUF4132 domain-containing protein [Roseimicrobium gellanilyticum]|nr:DUF4132 domain-containing protein [Roseimicrobium gellanilyticum]